MSAVPQKFGSKKLHLCMYARPVLKKFTWAFLSHETWFLAKPAVLFITA